MSADRPRRWKNFLQKGGTDSIAYPIALGILALELGSCVELDNVHNYPLTPRTAPVPTEFLGSVSNETDLARATARYYRYAKSEQEKADSMDILYKETQLTQDEVETLFGITPKEDEQWFAGWEAAIEGSDGGPEKIGIRLSDQILTLNERGIHALSDVLELPIRVKNFIKDDEHTADVEMSIAFYKIVDGKITYIGFVLYEHGDPRYVSAEKFEYMLDENGNLHAVIVKSIKKATGYESELKCNLATYKGKTNIGPFTVNGSFLRDRCARVEDSYTVEPEIKRSRNVGEPDNQINSFIIDPQLKEKYGMHESPWKENGEGNWFFGGVYSHKDYDDYTQTQIKEAQLKAPHPARFDWALPRRLK